MGGKLRDISPGNDFFGFVTKANKGKNKQMGLKN